MKNVDIFTMDYLFENGRNEDGGVITESDIFIVAEDTDGRRFSLNDSSLTTVMMNKEEINKVQERRIKKITDHLNKGGELNLENWNEINPVYGSVAYDKLDRIGYFKELELREEEEKY